MINFFTIHGEIINVGEIRYVAVNTEKAHVTVTLKAIMKEADKGYRRFFFNTPVEAQDCFDTVRRHLGAVEMTQAPSRPIPEDKQSVHSN